MGIEQQVTSNCSLTLASDPPFPPTPTPVDPSAPINAAQTGDVMLVVVTLLVCVALIGVAMFIHSYVCKKKFGSL